MLSIISCFTDDTGILLGIKDEDDTQMLLNDLEKLYIWEDMTNMSSMPASLNNCQMEKNRK